MNTLKKYWLTVFFLVGLFSTLAYAIYPLPANEDTTEAGNVIEKISKVKKVPLTFVPEKSSQTPPLSQRLDIPNLLRGIQPLILNLPMTIMRT